LWCQHSERLPDALQPGWKGSRLRIIPAIRRVGEIAVGLEGEDQQLLAMQGIELKREALSSKIALERVLASPVSGMVQLELRVLVGQIRTLTESIAELEERLEEEGQQLPGYEPDQPKQLLSRHYSWEHGDAENSQSQRIGKQTHHLINTDDTDPWRDRRIADIARDRKTKGLTTRSKNILWIHAAVDASSIR
jgi:hypothetical protein